jgi:hypothetical protein
MADNTAQARKAIDGHRRAIREHIDKYKRYTESYEKQGALRTIQRAQAEIRSLKSKHPSLNTSDSADSWRP